MDKFKLQYFIAAARCLNFSQVARTFYISQPAVSHQIKLLEEELGVALFAREGRQILLTSEGTLFLPEAVKILQGIQESVQLIQRHSQGESGRVSIIVANTNRSVYTRCLTLFTKRYPKIFIDTTVALGSKQSKIISKGQFDLCFVAEFLLGDSERYEYTVTFQDRLCLAVPKSFLPLEDISHDFSHLNKYPFIKCTLDSEALLHENIQQACSLRNYEPKAIHQYNRIDATLWSVEAGAGISIVPMSLIAQYATCNIEFIPIDGDDCAATCVAGWQKVSTNSSAQKFKDVIFELFPPAVDSVLQMD